MRSAIDAIAFAAAGNRVRAGEEDMIEYSRDATRKREADVGRLFVGEGPSPQYVRDFQRRWRQEGERLPDGEGT